MAWVPLGGTSRRFKNTETGETISRRQFQNLTQNISFEKKAKLNKQNNLGAALARPARGRSKATSENEIELRLQAAQEKAEQDNANRLNKLATSKAKKIKLKKIRPQLLKSGHRAARIPFNNYSDYQTLRKELLTNKLSNGKRLVSAYGLGIVGYDERTGKEIAATLYTMVSPSVSISEKDFDAVTEDFLMSHLYFIFSHYYLHLHFDREYAEKRAETARKKNIPTKHRKKK